MRDAGIKRAGRQFAGIFQRHFRRNRQVIGDEDENESHDQRRPINRAEQRRRLDACGGVGIGFRRSRGGFRREFRSGLGRRGACRRLFLIVRHVRFFHFGFYHMAD